MISKPTYKVRLPDGVEKELTVEFEALPVDNWPVRKSPEEELANAVRELKETIMTILAEKLKVVEICERLNDFLERWAFE